MSKIYIRVEAVNLHNFVYDTHDVSTIRGGSYLLLNAIGNLTSRFDGRLHLVAHAASQGIFWIDETENAKVICDEVLTWLNGETGNFATFLMAIQPDIPGDFPQVLEMLEAQIHRQQWRMPTVAIPERGNQVEKECYLDGWRPGTVKYMVDPTVNEARISKATHFRRTEGTKLRHNLFLKILNDQKYIGQISSKDLGELSQDRSRGPLNGKIAFFHVDGNGFGGIRRNSCKSSSDLEEFTTTIQSFRARFLQKLLEKAKSNPAYQTQNINGELALRLEILLWGGDEMTLIVPAWVGWEVARLFYEEGKDLAFKVAELTHRSALIFCHHNAPILLIRQLAENLLERTKRDIRNRLSVNGAFSGYDHKIGDSIHYLVLESFDVLQGDLDGFLENYYKGTQYIDLLIHAHEMDRLIDAVRSTKSLLAHSKAIEGIKIIRRGDSDAAMLLRQLSPKQKTVDDRLKLIQAIEQLTANNPSLWYLVTDLWDYLPE